MHLIHSFLHTKEGSSVLMAALHFLSMTILSQLVSSSSWGLAYLLPWYVFYVLLYAYYQPRSKAKQGDNALGNIHQSVCVSMSHVSEFPTHNYYRCEIEK